MDVLRFRDGHEVRFLPSEDGVDTLRMEHRWPAPGRLAGPHWHPRLAERFEVVSGRVRFRLDRRELVVGPTDGEVRVPPGTVHGFVSEQPELVLRHDVSPPLQHRQMFQYWHQLDAAGLTTASGLPRNPLRLAVLWELQDGYLAGIPARLQRMVFTALARIARRRGLGFDSGRDGTAGR